MTGSASIKHLRWFVLGGLAVCAAVVLVLVSPQRAEAESCCAVKVNGDTISISGDVAWNRGVKFITASIRDEWGREIAALKCGSYSNGPPAT